MLMKACIRASFKTYLTVLCQQIKCIIDGAGLLERLE